MPFGDFGACFTISALYFCFGCIGAITCIPCVTAQNRTSIRSKLNLRVRGI